MSSEKLVRDVVQVDSDRLTVCEQVFALSQLRQIAVVGGGKAGAGMAVGLEESLGPDLLRDKVIGWVNVPEDCVRPLKKIYLHGARPAGVNEPTSEGVKGSREILRIVSSLTAGDLCLVLISGGGSALLPAPKPPITLDEKTAVTRFLMHGGATIQELNAVRRRLSMIKGGQLARAARAAPVVSLIISDIVGDPLDLIASGPTYPDPTTDAEALAVLRKFDARPPAVPRGVIEYLENAAHRSKSQPEFPENVANHIIGNNATALNAAANCAKELGYSIVSLGSENEGEANEEGRLLADRCRSLREAGRESLPLCVLSGGEPIVRLAKTDKPRRGGRNQQVVLAALDALRDDGMERIVVLSGGTDGEDGPTDAAGAWADAELLQNVRRQGLEPQAFLQINDAYSFFDHVGGLLKTGPTHTNVMDLRVALVGRSE